MEISMILFLTITPRQGYNRIYCFSFLACSRYCLLRSHSCPLPQDKDIVEFFCPFLACFGYCPMVRETILGCCSSFVGEKGQKKVSQTDPLAYFRSYRKEWVDLVKMSMHKDYKTLSSVICGFQIPVLHTEFVE